MKKANHFLKEFLDKIVVYGLGGSLVLGPFIILIVNGIFDACTPDNPVWLCLKLFPSHYTKEQQAWSSTPAAWMQELKEMLITVGFGLILSLFSLIPALWRKTRRK